MSDAQNAQIAHVLFLDIVGFSRLSMTVQPLTMERLNAAVNGAPTYSAARERGAAQPVATGDGMILLFWEDVTAPVRCAIEIARALKTPPPIPVRMGIHSGLVYRQLDIAGNENIVGEGVNTAQRVMDFGDDGHILLSALSATWLTQFDDFQPLVKAGGEGVAKHNLRLSVSMIHGDGFGRTDTPRKLQPLVAAAGSVPRVAILYRRGEQADEQMLAYLEERLRADGLSVYVDRGRKVSSAWLKEVEERIREADAVIAVVSPQSLQSEMLEFELETAQDQQQQTGKPMILPVRLGLEEEDVNGPVAAVIGPLNQFLWSGPDDDQRLVAELISAIREPLKPRDTEIRLEPVGGAVPPDSPFYIERGCDREMQQAVAAGESILLIKGARQMGKTSLQARAAQQSRDLGWRVGLTDFQKLTATQMASEDVFYRLLAATLARQLKFKYDFENEWDDIFGANLNMETFLRELLEAAPEPLVWCMDEVDKLFGAPFASDFFGLVRSWHNARSTEPHGPWKKLTVVIAYATEAHLFIQDLNQSPFNVGRRFDLENFNLQQLFELNGRYGSPIGSYQEAEEIHDLLGGQPFLSRRALDVLKTGKWDFAGLIQDAARDNGPFSDHLQRVHASVSKLPEVTRFVRAVLDGSATPNTDQTSYYRLLASGIIQPRRDGTVDFRCSLYRQYLTMHPPGTS
ncbi:MAG: AAA-like domain-containing protein [Capsulimonadales bacterium]|nr:AAA-like domain-containing protein [Capsulimonadales bacterium]